MTTAEYQACVAWLTDRLGEPDSGFPSPTWVSECVSLDPDGEFWLDGFGCRVNNLGELQEMWETPQDL